MPGTIVGFGDPAQDKIGTAHAVLELSFWKNLKEGLSKYMNTQIGCLIFEALSLGSSRGSSSHLSIL